VSRTVLFSPEVRFNAARLAQLKEAKKGEEVYGCAYAFSLVPLFALIQTQAAAGIKHHWLFDHSQYASAYNTTMKKLVDALRANPLVEVVVGNAADGADISHDKFIIIGGRLVQYGSQNFTGDAEYQTGHVVLEANKLLAAAFLTHWQAIKAGMLAHPVVL
jgi:hypothetical protein